MARLTDMQYDEVETHLEEAERLLTQAMGCIKSYDNQPHDDGDEDILNARASILTSIETLKLGRSHLRASQEF
jgi:hypothetical protein